jgi:hypothetical protein
VSFRDYVLSDGQPAEWRQAYLGGVYDFQHGAAKGACPHPGGMVRACWRQGWEHARFLEIGCLAQQFVSRTAGMSPE